MKKTLSICLGILFALALTFVFLPTTLETPVAAATTDFSGGSGTESDPYLIKTKEHLNNVRKDLDAHYKMISDIVFTEADFAEGGDFYNGGTGWQPIGELGSDPSSRHEPSFSGTFDGNGHTIKNFFINIESDSYVFAGLFGYVYSGTIKNLGMEDSNITAISSAKNSYAGGIVGAAVDTEFTNCYNAGTVSGENAGGIVGGANFYVKLTSCYNTGTVSGNYAGGILGAEIASFMPDRYFHIVSNLEISNCYNTGTISATTEAGGILGMLSSYTESESTIRNCYNNGTISVTNLNPINTTYAAGGIVGDGSCISTIIDCHNTGTIESNVSDSTDGYAGGISGQGGTMTNCYNTGAVTGNYKAGGISGNGGSSNNCHNSGKIFASTFAGGIMGSGSATDCYNTGTIESASDSTNGYAGGIMGSGSATNCYNTGTVTGNHDAGGISGSGSATNCYNTGAVSGAGAGGIVGYVNKSVELTSCYNTGAVSGNCTGGIVGSTAYNSTTPTIRYCYNTGEISA
ncbi:MAG: hypothetical protein IKY59_03540, partial [Oscillospiraceae bacterium]|nr:hypothetical protein [Oscillospiraceae bacterium]